MRQEPPPAKRGSWPGLILWAALIVASIVLMSIGLWRAMFFGFMPPALVEDLRVGGLYVLAGAVASLAATALSVILRHPRWVIVFVAAPAVLVGGAALIEPTSLIRHMVAVVAFPLAVAGLYWGLRHRGYRRSG